MEQPGNTLPALCDHKKPKSWEQYQVEFLPVLSEATEQPGIGKYSKMLQTFLGFVNAGFSEKQRSSFKAVL